MGSDVYFKPGTVLTPGQVLPPGLVGGTLHDSGPPPLYHEEPSDSWSTSTSESTSKSEESHDSTNQGALFLAKIARERRRIQSDEEATADGVDAAVPGDTHFIFEPHPVPVDGLQSILRNQNGEKIPYSRDKREPSSQAHQGTASSASAPPQSAHSRSDAAVQTISSQRRGVPPPPPEPPVQTLQMREPAQALQQAPLPVGEDSVRLNDMATDDAGAEQRHTSRKCTPCVALIVTKHCQTGDHCQYCHFSHEDNMNREQRPPKEMRIRCKQAIAARIEESRPDKSNMIARLQDLVASIAPFSRNYTVKLLRDSQWLETGDSSAFWTSSTASSSSTSQPATPAPPAMHGNMPARVGKGESRGPGGKPQKGSSPKGAPQRGYQHPEPHYQLAKGGGKNSKTGDKGMPTEGKGPSTGGQSKGKPMGGKTIRLSDLSSEMFQEVSNVSSFGQSSWKGQTLIMRL